MSKQKVKGIVYIVIIIAITLSLYFVFINKDKNGIGKQDVNTVGNNDILSDKKNSYLDGISINKLAGTLYSESGVNNLSDKINYLVSKNDLAKASFLSSFLGDYKNALKYRNNFCEIIDNKENDSCKKVNTKLKLNIFDIKGGKIDGLKISVDGNIDYNSNKDLYNNFVHRLKISKKGYLDCYEKVVLGEGSDGVIDVKQKTVSTSYKLTVPSNKEISYKTKNFSYKIEPNSFVNLDGTPVSGNIDIYFFDIGAQDGDLSVLNLDAFDENGTLLGNSMTTLGMPLVKAYFGNNELKLIKEITGTGVIQNLERAPGIDLVNVPKNVYLGAKELEKYKIPPFWNLDQNNGVWKVSSMKILDEKGNYEFKLY